MTAIAPDVLDVLTRARVDDAGLVISEQLDPKLYAKVRKVLLGLGWKWHTGRQVHLPTSDAAREKLAAAVGAGSYIDPQKDMGWFHTPVAAADALVEFAGIDFLPAGARVLEPSAGDGALVLGVFRADAPEGQPFVVAVEPDDARYAKLRERMAVNEWPGEAYHMTLEEFSRHMDYTTLASFDAVVMNPPFTLPGNPTAWMDHVLTAWAMLKPGGTLAAIVPAGFEHRDDRKHRAMRQMVKDHDGDWEPLPERAFEGSGTLVRTLMIRVTKPEGVEAPPPPDRPTTSERVSSAPKPAPAAVKRLRDLAAAVVEPVVADARMVTVRVDRIIRREDQPREHFDQAALDELAESIRLRGLLQPPVVRRIHGAAGDLYELVAGERRWRAVRQLGWETVQVRETDRPDDLESLIDAITENVVRQDMTPMEEARAYGRLRDEAGMSLQQISAQFGKQANQVSWRLNLLGLTAEAQHAVERGTIKPYLAGELAKLKPGNQARVLARYGRGEFRTETEAIAVVNALGASEHQEVIIGAPEDDTTEAQQARARKVEKVDGWFRTISRLTETLDQVASADPGDLRDGLAGMAGVRVDELAAVGRLVRKAQSKLEAARALATLDDVDEEAVGA